MSQDEFVHIWAWADSWGFLLSLESTDWGGDFNTHNNIVDVAVFIFFHTGGSGADPAP